MEFHASLRTAVTTQEVLHSCVKPPTALSGFARTHGDLNVGCNMSTVILKCMIGLIGENLNGPPKP